MTKPGLWLASLTAVLLAATVGAACTTGSDYPAGSPPPGTVGPGGQNGDEGGCSAAEVQAVFNASCTGCHGSPGSAGLDLASGSLATRLSNKASSACSGKVLVVPGNAAASYLLDKLQGDATCGDPMPKGKPQLDATSINCVADWIDGLAASSGGSTPPGGSEPPGTGGPGGGW